MAPMADQTAAPRTQGPHELMLPLSVYEYSPRVRDADRLDLTSRLKKRWNLSPPVTASCRLTSRSDFANSETT